MTNDTTSRPLTPHEQALAAIADSKAEQDRLRRWIAGQPKPGGPTVFNPSPWVKQ